MDPEKKTSNAEHHEHQRRFEDDSGSTVQNDTVEGTLCHGNVPDVDNKYASEIKVSKLKGKWLTWMVSHLLCVALQPNHILRGLILCGEEDGS